MRMNIETWNIFNEHKESVVIVRGDAFENNQRDVVVESLECMVQPQRGGLTHSGGVGIDQSEMLAILGEPNLLIKKGDTLIRDDSSEFRVDDILHIKGTDVMELELKSTKVA